MSRKASAPGTPQHNPAPLHTRSTPAGAANTTSLHPPSRDGNPSEEAIRARAYGLWEHAGSPEGDGVEFWLRAEKELKSPL